MFWENNDAKRAAKAEEELVTTKLREVEAVAELKELRLRVMELETQVAFLLLIYYLGCHVQKQFTYSVFLLNTI